MRRRIGSVIGLMWMVAVAPAWAQTPDASDRLPSLVPSAGVVGASEEALAHRLSDEGYFNRCRAGDRKGCALFVQLVAARANPSASTASWGRLTKQPSETQHEGYAEDSIVYGADPNDLSNVIDMVAGAGAAGASIAWQPKPRRPGNTWATPAPLTAAEMEYLKPGSSSGGGGTGGGGGGGGGGTGSNDQLARIEQQLAALVDLLMGRYGVLLEQAATHATSADDRAEDLQHRAEDLKNRLEALEAKGWPVYSGSLLILGRSVPLELRPR